jgi:hypothetical protein
MDKTALSIAGAFTMTAAAAVTAMFLTVGAGAESSNPAPAATPIRYEVIEVPVDTTAAGATGATTVHEIEYVTAPPTAESALAPMTEGYDDEYEDHDDHDDEDEDDDDD